jgi:hypothetical protein
MTSPIQMAVVRAAAPPLMSAAKSWTMAAERLEEHVLGGVKATLMVELAMEGVVVVVVVLKVWQNRSAEMRQRQQRPTSAYLPSALLPSSLHSLHNVSVLLSHVF